MENIDKTDNIDMTLEEILVNLTLISKIEIGDKLYQNGKFINIDTSYFQFISRWISGNNRNDNLIFINIILNKAYEIASNVINERNNENTQQLSRLSHDLKNSITGLTNLKLTYYYDKLFQSEIDVIIENIRNKTEMIANNLEFSKNITKITDIENLNSNTNTTSNQNTNTISQNTNTISQNTNVNQNNNLIDNDKPYRKNKHSSNLPPIVNNNNN
jgi:signal transduction histidine kinase